ncbi:hypothetical protein [Flavobacterium sp.]|uniref:hypothetical protein n=1 Tax=Flavobacterium sp. TaxID=239 RepID=UPI003751D2F8
MYQKKSSFVKLFAFVLIIFQFYSCVNEPVDLSPAIVDGGNFGNSVLGEKKIIPFTVENMQNAYLSLLNNPTASKYPSSGELFKEGGYQIHTTHYYVKFHPQDSLQYERIINDSILEVSDEPFEYTIDSEGDKYQDPSLAGTQFTYYYSVMPVDHQFPQDVNFEIIANLHFTPEDEIGSNPSEIQKEEIDFYYDLNLETLKLTDNLDTEDKEELFYLFSMPNGSQQQMTYQEAINQGHFFKDMVIDYSEIDDETERRRSWNPSGIITVHEDAIFQNIGVNGARVRVRKWGFLVIRRATTNSQGFFVTSSTRTKRVKYSVFFKHNPLFVVKAGTVFWNARDIGHRTHKREAWRRHYQSGIKQFYSLIHNAAYDYYTRISPNYNIHHPGYYKKIVGKDWYNTTSHHLNNLTAAFALYDIRITRGSGGVYRGSDGIYATTVHELTHASHKSMDSGMFSVFESGSNNRLIIMESWAEGVETIVTNDRYNILTSNNYQSSSLIDNSGRWNSFRQR